MLAGVALGAVGWYISSQVLNPEPDHPSYSLRVLAVRSNTIEIPRTTATMRSGTYSLQWHGGRITLGAVVSSNGRSVVRRFTGNVRGLTVGTPTHLDIFMHSTPADLHIPYATVEVPDPLGPMPAWYIAGRSGTWVVVVHGRGSAPHEGLRALPSLVRLGLPVLEISYRNDPGAPAGPDHLYHLGASEWQDVQAGVRFALAHGARSIILYGYSMGGSLVESFLHRSPYAGRVRAAVLDAPALDWNAVLDFRAQQNNLPPLLMAIGKRFVAWRIGLSNLTDVTDVRTAADLRVPTLLIQGTGDTSIPWTANARLARSRPDLVTLVLVPGAEHTQEWNANPSLYTSRLRAFLRRFVG